MKETNPVADPIGQNLIKIIGNVCFSFFVVTVLVFTVIAITYQPPDPWLESAKALTQAFSDVENATFKTDDSVLKTGEDLVSIAPSSSSPPIITSESIQKSLEVQSSNCSESTLNCSDPQILATIQKFNLKIFKFIVFLDYQTPVQGSKPNECDVAWRFRNKKERTWRKYRDFRRFRFTVGENCSYQVVKAGSWHSGLNARRTMKPKLNSSSSKNNGTSIYTDDASPAVVPVLRDDDINDTIPTVGSESTFMKGKYLYYSRGGDYCKGMNHYLWSFLCGLGEAQYLNRTFVMDLSICLAASYNPSNKDEEGKDFRFYFDFEHLKESTPIVEEGEFLKEWKKLNKIKANGMSVRKVPSHKITPMQLKKEKSTIIWRQFDAPEPDNYWYRVCEGQAAKYVQRPWNFLWKSKRLMNLVTEISGQLDWDFDAVHVIRGEKAQNKKLWPNLDSDTSPESLLAKLKTMIQPRRKLYIATNEPFYNYFDKLRSQFEVHLLDDYKKLWGDKSEWYNETKLLNDGRPVNFDGYMRAAVDTEVLYRAKTQLKHLIT